MTEAYTWRVLVGDVLEQLATLRDASVQCVVTSPPYWGLRDYGTATWDGGDPACAHSVGNQVSDSMAPGAITTGQRPGVDASVCRLCHAIRIDAQLGLEPTPDAYVSALVAVFRDVRRVLKDDGVLWLNLGDSYAGSWGAQSRVDVAQCNGNGVDRLDPLREAEQPPTAGDTGSIPVVSTISRHQVFAARKTTLTGSLKRTPGLKPKDLVGIPWMVAFALRSDGWYLRSDIIWSKNNPMPESVTDRPTKSHEYLFLLSKSARYFYDADAIAEPASLAMQQQVEQGYDGLGLKDYKGVGVQNPSTVKARIIANARRKNEQTGDRRKVGFNARWDERERHDRAATMMRNARSVWTIATQPYFNAHFATFPEAIPERCIKAGSRLGDMVLDPFCGSGTTGQVAIQLGRSFIGIELNADYAALARTRIGSAAPLFAEAIA